jgi:hypothetical protein
VSALLWMRWPSFYRTVIAYVVHRQPSLVCTSMLPSCWHLMPTLSCCTAVAVSQILGPPTYLGVH